MQPQKPTPQKPSPPASSSPPAPPSAAAPKVHPKAEAAAAAAAAAAKPNRHRLPVAIGSAAAMVLVCALTLWAVSRDDGPRLNEDTVTLVKFVSGKSYAKLPFERQVEYMKVLEDRDDNDELEAAFEARKVTEGEYRAALLEAWLGQQVKRGEKYASLPPGPARDRYVWELLEKKGAKDARKAAKGKSGDGPPKVKRDKALEDGRIAAWPDEPRMNWEQYRKHYEAQREAREGAVTAPAGGDEPGGKRP